MKVKPEDIVNIVTGSYWVGDEQGTVKAKQTVPKGKGWVTIGLGYIDIGEDAEKEVKRLCNQLRNCLDLSEDKKDEQVSL